MLKLFINGSKTRLTAVYFLILLVSIGLLSSCLTIRLIGDYDETIDLGVTEIQQKVEQHMATLTSTPSTPFDQAFYDDLKSRIIALQSRAKYMARSDILSQQLSELTADFADLQKLDQITSRPIKVGSTTGMTAFDGAKSSIETVIGAILKLEIGLKRGTSNSQ